MVAAAEAGSVSGYFLYIIFKNIVARPYCIPGYRACVRGFQIGGTIIIPRALSHETLGLLDFPYRHAIGQNLPDAVAVRKVCGGRQPATGSA